MKTKVILMISVLLLLFGCAMPTTAVHSVDKDEQKKEELTQKKLAFRAQWIAQLRVVDVGYSMLKFASDQCGETVRNVFGYFAAAIEDVPKQYRVIATDAVGLDGNRRVYRVYRNSPAEVAGLKVGDIITNGPVLLQKESRADIARKIPVGVPVTFEITRKVNQETDIQSAQKPEREIQQKKQSNKTVKNSLLNVNEVVADRAKSAEHKEIPIVPSSHSLTLKIAPEAICDYPIRLTEAQEVNAYADGKAIYITRGMERFASEDRELAIVIGHELGHNVMGHTNKKTLNSLIGIFFDALAASKGVNTSNAFQNAGMAAYSQDFEREADYVGMYYLVKAGYQIDGAADFWRRMAVQYPSNISGSHSATHPATSERFLALEKTVDEIHAKQAAKQELAPNMK